MHEIATGFDEVNGSLVNDWTQRGFALGDIDGDGDIDIIALGGILENTVLRNDNGTFTDISGSVGIEVGEFDTAPALFDFDLDGDNDLIIGVLASGGTGGHGVGRNRFYRNNGDGTLDEISTLTGTYGGGHTIFVQVVDLDLDGLLDLYLSEFYTSDNIFYRNNGDGTFTDVGAAIGLDLGGSTHVTAILDSDDDDLLDVFVGNDFIVSFYTGLPNNERDFQAQGQADGTWLDVSAGSGTDLDRGIMGITLGDVDYDGDFDMYKTDVNANRMMVNHGWPGGSPWTEDQDFYGIAADSVPDPFNPPATGRGIGWGAVFMDFDFDLWLDLFLVNGQVAGTLPLSPFSTRGQRNFLWTGDGPSNQFKYTDETLALGIYDEIDDRCCGVADFDQDGDIDILIAPTVGFLRYFENQVDPLGQGYLMVKPVCTTSAPGGFGVKARFIDSLGFPHERVIGQDGPTAAQHENFAYFGLGNETSVDLEVEFPSGVTLSFPGTLPDTTVTPVEPKLISVSARTLPIARHPQLGGTNRQPASTTYDLYVVSAFAHDQAGNPLDASANVTIDVPGLTPLAGVLHIQGNEFRRYYQNPLTTGSHRATVTFDGWEVRIKPRIIFYDPTDASGTTVAVIPEAVRAGSADTFEVVIAPKDTGGISLGSGETIGAQIAGVNPITGPIDLGDGRYRYTFPAPATAGFHPITISHNGQTLSVPATIEAGGAFLVSSSELLIQDPNPVHAAAPHQYKVLLTPRDSLGARLGPKAVVTLASNPDPGTGAVVVRQDLYPGGQRDGDFPFILEKLDPATAASGTLDISVEGALVASIPYDF
ncbi:MAG: FG-GAP-like repeat-containing protein [Planctomycetota bacterium]|nr:FG-GAP-like repeat-containing protein [Planctomycetota bacterium]